MAVHINDTCITCNACVEVCPVDAISDDEHNPLGKPYYYVHPETCVECVGIYDDPQCAAICPSIGCITWDRPYTKEHTGHFLDRDAYRLSEKNGVLRSPEYREKKYRNDIPLAKRDRQIAVETPPEASEQAG